MMWEAYNDAASRAVYEAFKEHITPFLAVVCPDWTLHHIKILRHEDWVKSKNEVEIRLVIRPVGEVREVPEVPAEPRRIK